MNKVITLHLNGNAYQLEEAGYEALRSYLDNAARQLAGNPDKDEILADIEQAIADKCRALLNGYRTVVFTREIEQIIVEMGPVEAGTGTSDVDGDSSAAKENATSAPGDESAGAVRRIYRIHEGAIVSGVCNGIAAYLGIDPTIVRVLFVILAFATLGGMALAYLVLVLLLPIARTPTEKASAQGTPATAQEFIRRAREGYYEATKTFHDRHLRREWKRRFRDEMRAWRRNVRHGWQTHAPQWQSQWQSSSGAVHPGADHGLWFTVSLLAVLRGVLTFGWIFAMISLVTSGAVFGLALPTNVPLWVGLLVLCVLYQVVATPLRAARYALCQRGWSPAPCAPAFLGLWDTLVGLAVVVLLIWCADRYVPHAHEALMNLPPAIRHAIDTIRQWWSRS